jgi:hypothetical protein
MWWHFFNEQYVIMLGQNVLNVTEKDTFKKCKQTTLGSMKSITTEDISIVEEK